MSTRNVIWLVRSSGLSPFKRPVSRRSLSFFPSYPLIDVAGLRLYTLHQQNFDSLIMALASVPLVYLSTKTVANILLSIGSGVVQLVLSALRARVISPDISQYTLASSRSH
jgi:hypothetical protein